jgi:hypothetical protein
MKVRNLHPDRIVVTALFSGFVAHRLSLRGSRRRLDA